MSAHTKADIVRAVADRSGLTQVKAEEVLTAILDDIRDALARREKVTLVGFGSFDVHERSERPGINPRTGEAMQIGASHSIRFRAGKGLKDAVTE